MNEAQRARQAAYYRNVVIPRRRAAGIQPPPQAKHPSKSARDQHRRIREPLCAACAAWEKGKRRVPAPCGTPAAKVRHYRRGEQCAICRTYPSGK